MYARRTNSQRLGLTCYELVNMKMECRIFEISLEGILLLKTRLRYTGGIYLIRRRARCVFDDIFNDI